MIFFEITIFAGIMILIAFAIQLFAHSQGNLLLNKLLGFLFLSRAINSLFFLALCFKDNVSFSPLTTIVPIVIFLGPPAIYLYIRSFVFDQSRLRRSDILHLIPAFLVLIDLSPLIFSSTGLKSEIIKQLHENSLTSFRAGTFGIPINILFTLRSVQAFIYLGFSWVIVLQGSNKQKQHRILKHKYFLVLLLLLSTVSHLSAFLSTVYLTMTHNPWYTLFENLIVINVIYLLMFLYIIWILLHPSILYGNLSIDSIKTTSDPQEFDLELSSSLGNVNNLKAQVIVPEDQIVSLLNRIENHMEHDKPYLSSTFNIQLLSGSLDVPVYHCSYILNQIALKSFRDYINGLRIQYFITTYGPTMDKFTIEHQTALVGFNNRSTFYLAFKKETGFSPRQYFDQLDSNVI